MEEGPQLTPIEREERRLCLRVASLIRFAMDHLGIGAPIEMEERYGLDSYDVLRCLAGSPKVTLALAARIAFVLGKRFRVQIVDWTPDILP